jgi:hypothetical protein
MWETILETTTILIGVFFILPLLVYIIVRVGVTAFFLSKHQYTVLEERRAECQEKENVNRNPTENLYGTGPGSGQKKGKGEQVVVGDTTLIATK